MNCARWIKGRYEISSCGCAGRRALNVTVVRGGIPLVFPVFGKATEGPTAALPQHGFARISKVSQPEPIPTMCMLTFR
jgi:hypothetical protein